MMNEWEIWLAQNPSFSFAGKDSDGEDAVEYSGENDYESDESGEDSGYDDADRSDDSSDDADEDDTSRRIRRLENDNKKLSRELEAAVELLNQAADSEGSDEAPEGFVPQEDYDALIDLLRTDYIEHAIANFRKKDGSPKWDWEDPSAVYKFLDVDELEVDVKTRTIDGLEDQLADIAERYPFMLRSGGKRREGNGSTGKLPRKSGAREQHKNPSIEALVAEFPALVD